MSHTIPDKQTQTCASEQSGHGRPSLPFCLMFGAAPLTECALYMYLSFPVSVLVCVNSDQTANQGARLFYLQDRMCTQLRLKLMVIFALRLKTFWILGYPQGALQTL